MMRLILFSLWPVLSLAENLCPVAPGTLGRGAHPALQHIIVIMQENHSFDSYLGGLNNEKFYGSSADGRSSSLDPNAFHQIDFCPRDPEHSWEAAHQSLDQSRPDQFGVVNQNGIGNEVHSYQTESEIPLYYQLANQFSTADRYFSSLPGPTFPNRFYLYAGTSFGHIQNDEPPPEGFHQKTIFDSLNAAGVTWKYYRSLPGDYLRMFAGPKKSSREHFGRIQDFKLDLSTHHLPQVVFLESAEYTTDEHPPANLKWGQSWVYKRLQELKESNAWKSSAVFLTWDENGGFYDHVTPPAVCPPDDLQPSGVPTKFKAFDQLGFRVPFILISPYSKRHFLSHSIFEHSSILKFIEDQHGLPYLTRRDANANSLSELFDFEHPNFAFPELMNPDSLEALGCHDLKTLGQNWYNLVLQWMTNNFSNWFGE